MTTVVPVRLMRSRTFMMPIEVAGSMFPVGSSARRIIGRLTNARAIATRCCSPPGELVGHPIVLALQAHQVKHLGDDPADEPPRHADRPRARNATFCSTVLPRQPGRRIPRTREPILRRRAGTFQFVRRARSVPRHQDPAAVVRALLAEDQPEERGTCQSRTASTRKTNSPLLTVQVDVPQARPDSGSGADLGARSGTRSSGHHTILSMKGCGKHPTLERVGAGRPPHRYFRPSRATCG